MNIRHSLILLLIFSVVVNIYILLLHSSFLSSNCRPQKVVQCFKTNCSINLKNSGNAKKMSIFKLTSVIGSTTIPKCYGIDIIINFFTI